MPNGWTTGVSTLRLFDWDKCLAGLDSVWGFFTTINAVTFFYPIAVTCVLVGVTVGLYQLARRMFFNGV